jgi:glycosyltransferase involved in cell wall biosynthesis
MNILFVSHGGRRSGGAQNVLYDLLKALHPTYFNCHCLFPEGGQFAEKVRALGVTTHFQKFAWWAGFELDTLYKIPGFCMDIGESVKAVQKIIEQNHIDLVVSNTLVMAEGAFAAFYSKVPHIWYVHEILSRDPKLKHLVKLEFLYPLMHYMTTLIVGVSNAVRDEFAKYFEYANKERVVVFGENERDKIKFDMSKIRTCYNGVHVPDACPEYAENNVVLSVGGVCRRKGQMDLLRAARYVIDEIPDARFIQAGKFWENGYRREILDERVRLGIGKKFAFEKWVEDMPRFYRNGSVLVSPSHCESFGLSLLEGMAQGLPVVSTRSGGPEEIVVNNTTGFLVDVGDVTGLASCIIGLLKNRRLARQMGKAGYHRVCEHFTHGQEVDTFIKYILEAVKK